jgi:hypothetical protein
MAVIFQNIPMHHINFTALFSLNVKSKVHHNFSVDQRRFQTTQRKVRTQTQSTQSSVLFSERKDLLTYQKLSGVLKETHLFVFFLYMT